MYWSDVHFDSLTGMAFTHHSTSASVSVGDKGGSFMVPLWFSNVLW